MEPGKTVAMDGAAWLASSVVEMSREEFITNNMGGIAFFGKSDKVRRQMLGQVWDICAGSAVRNAKKKKK